MDSQLQVARGWPSMVLAALVLALATCPAGSLQPRAPGSLSIEELQNITSVECLEARQRDPNVVCDNLVGADGQRTVHVEFNVTSPEQVASLTPAPAVQKKRLVIKYTVNQSAEPTGDSDLSLYNYPDFKDASCNSGGAHFCDPFNAFSQSEGQNLSKELDLLSKEHLVTCDDLVREPIDERHLQPFYLGVALAEASGPDVDYASLRQYGHLIMSEWNIDEVYAAKGQVTRCPNQALLLVIPAHDKAVLVSDQDSCQFICEEHGGAETQRAVERALRGHAGVSAAVLAGVRTAYASLSKAVREGEDMPALERSEAPAADADAGSWVLFLERAIFAFAVMALAMSLLVGLLVMFFAPGLAKGHRGYA